MSRTHKDRPYKVRLAREKALPRTLSTKRSRTGVKNLDRAILPDEEHCDYCNTIESRFHLTELRVSAIFFAHEQQELNSVLNSAKENGINYSIRQVEGFLKQETTNNWGVSPMASKSLQLIDPEAVIDFSRQVLRFNAKNAPVVAESSVSSTRRWDRYAEVAESDISDKFNVFHVVEFQIPRNRKITHQLWHEDHGESGFRASRGYQCSCCDGEDARDIRVKNRNKDRNMLKNAQHLALRGELDKIFEEL